MAKKSKRIQATRKSKFSVRQHNRCHFCGRPRGYLRKFGMCRVCFREKAGFGLLPGVTKSSW